MSSRNFAAGTPRTSLWQLGSLRLTAFCITQPDVRTLDWWQGVAGCPSETRNVQAGTAQLTEQGMIVDRVLRLQVQAGRVDWILSPRDDPQNTNFPLLGNFRELASWFENLMSPWLIRAPRINRLAFGAVLYVPTDSVTNATMILSQLLPRVNIEWPRIRDFVLQVNRPAPGTTYPEAGEIQRISKWQTIVLKKMITVLQGDSPGLTLTTSEQAAAYWELDISTPPVTGERMEIPAARLAALFHELAGEGAGMLEGDVP